jgi:hypothetical protein
MKKLVRKYLKKLLSEKQRENIKKLASYFDDKVKDLNTRRYQARNVLLLHLKSRPIKRVDKKISIIIPTLSQGIQADHLPKLETLLKEYLPRQSHENYEAIVYCDGQNKMVEDMVSSLKDRRIKVCATDMTLGKWGHPQTRMGILEAEGDFFVRMNDDNKPYENYLQTLVNGFDGEAGIAYGRIIYKGEARRVHGSSLIRSFVLPADKAGILRIQNIDCMNYMVEMNLAKSYVSYWDDRYAADWFFLEALLNNGIKSKFCDVIIGEKF